jgi:hypothetical protein
MLDPRIYRTGLVAVALAVIVLAFSLQGQPGPARATLSPDAFTGQFAFSQMGYLSTHFPNRRPGSNSDDALATWVANALRGDRGFSVSTSTFSARTVDGTRTLETVTATRPGLVNGTIVVVAHRDALTSPSVASMSGTATLLDLGAVLSGETLRHTIVLASISGSDGGAGAAELARSLPGPIDSVIALGDLAGTHVREPVVVPWSNGLGVAPPELRNTVAASLSAQAGLRAGGTSLAGQFAHLAFPLSTTEQGAFGAHGEPAVLLSVSGERGPSPGEQVSEAQLNGLGRTVLTTISALDSTASMPAPSAYLLFSGKVIPPWAIRLLALVLILPVVGVAIDGLARANRRGHSLTRPALSVLGAAAPFALAALAIVGAKLAGLLSAAPPGAVGPGTVPLHSGGIVLLVALALLIVGGLVLGRWLSPHATKRARNAGAERDAGAAAVLPAVMCAVAVAIWLMNPFAALLIVPAMHLWMWIVDRDRRVHPAVAVALLLVGLAPAILIALYYAISLSFAPGALIWTGVLMVAGGQIGLPMALAWCLVLGCTVRVIVIAARGRLAEASEPVQVTVRGPATYAGPGSLGGTESALRR